MQEFRSVNIGTTTSLAPFIVPTSVAVPDLEVKRRFAFSSRNWPTTGRCGNFVTKGQVSANQ